MIGGGVKPGLAALVLVSLSAAQAAWGAASICDLRACTCQSGGASGRLACNCRDSDLQELVLQGPGGINTKDLQTQIPETISSITIEDCELVRVEPYAFSKNSALHLINLTNISTLDLNANSFSWHHANEENRHPGLKISISNSFIDEIPSYSFKGIIHTIHLLNNTIENIQVFSFASLINTERIDIIDCQIKNIESQAFKRFSLASFIVHGSQLPILPSRAMVELEIKNEMRFEKVDFDVIRTSAIKAHGMQVFRIVKCKISRLERESLIVRTEGSVIMHDNLFQDIMTDSITGLTVEPLNLSQEGKKDFTFVNNSIVSYEINALTFNTSMFTPRLELIIFLKACTCANTKVWISQFVLYATDGGEIEPPNNVASLMQCKTGKELTVVKQFLKSNCQDINFRKYIIIIAFIIVSIIACAGTFTYIFKNRMKKYINVPTNIDGKMSFKNNKTPIMVVPDGKTYRETELHVIVEHPEPMVEYVPPHTTKLDFTMKT